MREIKFRKWDYENNEMIDGDSLAFELYAPISNLLTQKGIMQYTGLNDRNGKEIYEGDIFENDREDTHEIVTFDEGSFWSEGSTYTSPLHEINTKSKEVIGNIYQHPHLLEVSE